MDSCRRTAVLMKLSEIRSTLKEIGVSPVKTLGQNFLHDQNLARCIVDQAQITPQDYVVEIGPGLGALTSFLLWTDMRGGFPWLMANGAMFGAAAFCLGRG